MNIVFDLDGTVLSSSERLFKLFNHLVPDSQLTSDQYWALKFSNMTNEKILKNYFNYNDQQTTFFLDDWMKLIESEDFLSYDSLIDGALSYLIKLSKEANLHLCTARQSKEKLYAQMDRLGLHGIFQNILVTEQKSPKEHLISTFIPDISRNDWIIGDTGKDIQTGKALGIKTCAVLSGFTNKFNLLKYNPDKVISDITCFNIIKN